MEEARLFDFHSSTPARSRASMVQPPTPGSPSQPGAGLLELGSHGLRVCQVQAVETGESRVDTHVIPWRVGHLFFAGIPASDPAFVHEISQGLRRARLFLGDLPPSSLPCLATGIFGGLEDFESLAGEIERETGCRPRRITGEVEASLLADTLRERAPEVPLACFDPGGVSLEWAWFPEPDRGRWGSLPLGVIVQERDCEAHRDSLAEFLGAVSSTCDRHLADLPIRGAVQMVLTGGLARFLRHHFSGPLVTLDALRHLTVYVLENGAPGELPPGRSETLPAGLIIVWRLAVRVKAREIYLDSGPEPEARIRRLWDLLATADPSEDFGPRLRDYSLRLREEMELPRPSAAPGPG